MIVHFKALENVRWIYKHRKIVFCSGCFDLPHPGHVVFFEECKKLGDLLVVMVARDSNVRNNKGEKRPIMGENLRLKMIDSLKPVDICLFDLPFQKEDPLGNLVKVFISLRPDLYVVNEDAFDLATREKMVKECGVTMRILRPNDYGELFDISTTKIIERVKNL